MVAGRCTARATHRSDSLGFAATDRAVAFDGMCIARVRDGQIVEAWNNFDFLSMYRQLGVLEFKKQ
jgi:predicted ester cyclase